jgi:hypothetical protein
MIYQSKLSSSVHNCNVKSAKKFSIKLLKILLEILHLNIFKLHSTLHFYQKNIINSSRNVCSFSNNWFFFRQKRTQKWTKMHFSLNKQKTFFSFQDPLLFGLNFSRRSGMFDLSYFDYRFGLCSTTVLNYVRQQLWGYVRQNQNRFCRT